jgi:hypothetical protein
MGVGRRPVVHEIRGSNTGQDIISALDASVLNPSYKAGLLRGAALHDLEEEESVSGIPSVALGRLGPPELSKLLFEGQLFKHAFQTMAGAIAACAEPDKAARALESALEPAGVARTAPSIGIPVLLPDGRTLLRGPRINVPELVGHAQSVDLGDPARVDRWATKGWIDLRPSNITRGGDRFAKMVQARADLRDLGSAAANTGTYSAAGFEIGDIVAWIFNNEMKGFRIK